MYAVTAPPTIAKPIGWEMPSKELPNSSVAPKGWRLSFEVVASSVDLNQDLLQHLERDEDGRRRPQRAPETCASAPAVQLARPAQELPERPAVPEAGEIDPAPASEYRRHDEKQQEAQPQSDGAQGRLGLEVDELRDVLDHAAERGGRRRGREARPPAASGCPARIPSIQVNGCSHWSLVVGLGGRSSNPFSRWPQWPRKVSHWNSLPRGAVVGDDQRRRARLENAAPCVSSQPTPEPCEPFWM